MRFHLRPACAADARHVGLNLRAWDSVECLMHGVDGFDYLRHAIAPGVVTLVGPSGDPAGVGAVCGTDEPGHGTIWFLGTYEIEDHPRAFLEATRRMLPVVCEGWASVGNYIPTMRHDSRRWLRALGFDFGPAFLHGSGMEVVPFRKTFSRPSLSRTARKDTRPGF